MAASGDITVADPWNQLARYRQRYDIEDQLGPLVSLEQSIRRRRTRLAAIRRRVEELETMLSASQRELTAIEREIAESSRVGGFLIDEILDRVRIEQHEAWSPSAVFGFRKWQVRTDGLYGAKQRWLSPTMDAECLRRIPGDDVPHAMRVCGPPACGIYATKGIEMFGSCAWGLSDGEALGLVAMTGKVIEHEHGYRGAKATLVAVAARYRGMSLRTAEPGLIEELFDGPPEVFARAGDAMPPTISIDAFLNATKQKEESWT